MKALVYVAPGEVEVRNVPEPTVKPGTARVKMHYCGVCGSDISIVAGKHPRAKAPLVLGHEFIGTVEEIDNGGGRIVPGDRVVAYPLISCGECLPCRTGHPHVCQTLKLIGIDVDGGMAEAAVIDEDVLFRVPDAMSDEVAALVEPLAVIVRSLHQARFNLLDSAVVVGAGPIGILTAIVLRHSGASRIFISDIDASRLQIAAKLGFETVDARHTDLVELITTQTSGSGVDVVFECSGAENAALEMSKLARVGGMICLTGVHKAPHAVDLRDINFKEQIIIGSRVYTKREFETAVDLASDIADDLMKIVTQIIPLSQSETLFDLIANPDIATSKILVDCTK